MSETYKQTEFVFPEEDKIIETDLRSIIYAGQLLNTQPDLPLNQNEEGYNNWHSEQQSRIESISEEWHVPLYKNAKVWLKNIPGTLVGKVLLKEFPKEPFDHKKQDLHLVLDEIEFKLEDRKKVYPEFMSSEIDYWRLISPNEEE